MFERLRDWLRERLRRRPVAAYLPVSDLSTDYDFQMLLQTELAAIKPNLRLLRKISREGYIQLGGNPDNARQIVVTVGCFWLEKRLKEKDLPGPDAYIIPEVMKLAQEFIGKAFDDFFTDNPNVPLTGSND